MESNIETAVSAHADKTTRALAEMTVSSAKDDCNSATADVDRLCDLFTRFEIYDFDGDRKFQSGLTKISGLPDWAKTRDSSSDLLKIKAFYYSKNVEPLSLPGYLAWKGQQTTSGSASRDTSNIATKPESHPTKRDSDSLPVETEGKTNSAASDSSQAVSEKFEMNNNPDTNAVNEVSVKVEDRTDTVINSWTSSETDGQLSFTEIAELIQSGKPIPGLVQVDVTPTNEDPTPSQLSRAKKPWEI